MDVNLVLSKKDGTKKLFQLSSGVTVIGRHPDCHLRVPVKQVSRKHCQLSHSEGQLKIRDLDSLNGTFLNGKRIDEAVMQTGDQIKVGPAILTLQIGDVPEKVDSHDASEFEMTQPESASGDSTISS